jgi:hypothetical protein
MIILLGLFSIRLFAQAPNEQMPGQTPAVQNQSQAPNGTAAHSEYPLDAFTEFSALVTGSRMGTGDEVHMYRSGKMMRVEGPEKHAYFLTDLDALQTYLISADLCSFDASHPYFRTSPFPAAKGGATVTRVAVGKETVEGHSCQIEDVTIKSSKPGVQPLKMRLWEAEDLRGFPIKIEFPGRGDKKGSTIEYRNVVLGPQDPTLFIHPKSCVKMPSKEEMSKDDSSEPGSKKPKAPASPKKPSSGENK